MMKVISGGLRTISGNRIPLWNPYIPLGAKRIMPLQVKQTKMEKKVVYFPSCINRSMGVSKEQRGEQQLSEKMLELLNKGEFEVITPENLDRLCCGMAFSSKGYTEAGNRKSNELEAALLKASEQGKYPILCDMSPCLYTMKDHMGERLKLYEPVDFILDYLLPELEITPLQEAITVFPVCSMKKMGLEEKLKELAPFPVGKVFFACSGSEANDSQIKFAWYAANARGKTAKKKIIARHGAYHGVTLATARLASSARTPPWSSKSNSSRRRRYCAGSTMRVRKAKRTPRMPAASTS